MGKNPNMDFLNYLEPDMSKKILMLLDDPSDFVRASCVSRSWQRFVIQNGLCKMMCLGMFPQLSRIDHVIDSSCRTGQRAEIGPSNNQEQDTLEIEHRAYAFLARGCKSFPVSTCISNAIIASSTDNFPEESIHNTMDPRDRVGRRGSYWSSTGQSDPLVPERLAYKLVADLCVISEIHVQPFRAFFQRGWPIYSAKAVRFKIGHAKSPIDNPEKNSFGQISIDNNFEWTYTSEEFPMQQENQVHKYKLPEPVLGIGGYLLIELLGRVQAQQIDCLYYICVSHVQVVGRSLGGVFGVEILNPSHKFVLKALTNVEPKVVPVPNLVSEQRIRRVEHVGHPMEGNIAELINIEWELEFDEDSEQELGEEEDEDEDEDAEFL